MNRTFPASMSKSPTTIMIAPSSMQLLRVGRRSLADAGLVGGRGRIVVVLALERTHRLQPPPRVVAETRELPDGMRQVAEQDAAAAARGW